ncbi:hypothetical protein [Azospirillum sp. sgz301742]
MCAGVEGCFLIRAYQQNLRKHGHAEAVSAAARLYQRTNTDASDEEALAFVTRFVTPTAAVADCEGCTHAG